MAEIYFENGRISNFQRHVTLTLTLDQAIWHTFVNHSSTSNYVLNSFEAEKLFVDRRTYVRTYGQTDGRIDIEAGFIRKF